MMEKVLVLLATFNGEKYLSQQLDSLFAQEAVEVTVLVRDDGSSDGTTGILEEYQRLHNLSWYQGDHVNVQKGYMELLKKATETDYQFFAFCDQDDVWDKDKLSIGVNRIKENPGDIPLLYYSGQRLVDENLGFIEDHTMNRDRTDYARFILNDAAGCTEVFNRKLVETVASYTPSYILMHDAWILKVCLATGGRILVDPNSHMSYRQHGRNVMGLRRDFRSKLKRVKHYIEEQKVEPQMKELASGYQNDLTGEYKTIIQDVLSYKKSLASRNRLLNKSRFNYYDKGLQLTYYLKIMLNKL